LNEDVIRLISAKKNEPEFMLEWRLRAYRHWVKLEKSQAEPKWAMVHYPPLIIKRSAYYSAPKSKADAPKSLAENRSGTTRGLREAGNSSQGARNLAGVAVDAVFDSVSSRRLLKQSSVSSASSSALFRGRAQPSGTGPEVSRLGSPLHR